MYRWQAKFILLFSSFKIIKKKRKKKKICSYIILATACEELDVYIDWDFLECIYNNRNAAPTKVPEEERKNFKFDPSKYYDAVIMPWYRSQDQPQVCYQPNKIFNKYLLKSIFLHCFSIFMLLKFVEI